MPTVSEKPEDYAAPTHTEVLSWFEKALNVNEPKPSVEMCIDLAEKFKLLRNRARNEQIQESARKENRALSLFEPGLRDTVFADWERAKLQPVIDAAGLFLDAADRLLV